MRALRILKKSAKVIAVILLAVVVIALAGVGFLETSPGKHLIASLVQKYSGKVINGRVIIGSIRGGLLHGLTLHDVVVENAQGEKLGQVENLTANYRLKKLSPLDLVIDNIRIEQPHLFMRVDKKGRSNWDGLVKTNAENEPEEKKSGPASFWLKNAFLVEGTFERRGPKKSDTVSVYPINVELTGISRELDRLPEARIFAAGSWMKLPLKLAASIKNVAAKTAPGKLSGVLKTPPANLQEQHLAIVGGVGKTVAEASGEGVVDFTSLLDSDFTFNLNRFHFEPDELSQAIPSAPKQSIDARAFIDLHARNAQEGLEVHMGDLGKLIIKANMADVPEKLSKVRKVTIQKFRFDAECPLFILSKPTTLTFTSHDVAPMGNFKLSGCGGGLSYENSVKSGLKFDLHNFLPGKYLQALAIPSDRKDMGHGNVSVRLPRGAKVGEGELHLNFVPPQLVAGNVKSSIDLNARLKDSHLVADAKASLDDEHVDVKADIKHLLKPGTWKPTVLASDAKIEVSAKKFDLKKLGQAGLAPTSLTEKVTTQITATYNAHRGKIDAVLGLADMKAPLKMKGEMQVPVSGQIANAPIQWQMDLKDFNLARLLVSRQYLYRINKSLKKKDDKPRVYLSLQGSGAGTASHPSGNFSASLDSGDSETRTHFASLAAKADEKTIDARLVSKNGQLDPFIAMFVNGVTTENGRLNSDLHAVMQRTDDPKAPLDLKFDGGINVTAEKLRVVTLSTSYDDLNLNVLGLGRRVEVKNIDMKSGSGSFHGDGGVTLAQGPDAEKAHFNAKFNKFEALANEKMKLTTTGELNLNLNRTDAKFSGNLNVASGEITIPDNKGKKSVESLDELADVTEKEKPEDTTKPNRTLTGAININVPGRFWVKSSDIAVELSANLQAGIDSDSDTFVTGTVKGQRGFAEFFGRHFDIRRALVEFTGDPTNPRLDAEAVYPFNPKNIVVALNGDLDRMKPRLSSDPAGYSQDECIGVLMTGSPDFQGHGPSKSAGSMATGAISGYVAGALKKELGSKLPIDTLTVSTGSTPTANQAGAAGASASQNNENNINIEAGKYITDKLFVKAGHGFNTQLNQPESHVAVDYKLSERWSIETIETNTGRSDVGFLWSLNY